MFTFQKQFSIDNKIVGEGQPVYVIAEAGVSHFGEEEKAYQLVDMAVEAKADAVKFQVFDIDQLLTKDQKEWRERLGPRSLSQNAFTRIQKYCKEKGITFFATAHDDVSLEFLRDIDVSVFKVGSGELGNESYFRKIASFGKPVIWSTGMYSLPEIEATLRIFNEQKNSLVSILHCVTSYPTAPEDVNLFNIKYLEERFGVVAGYSDHTEGYHIPLAAVALGAKIIEKHITLEFNIPNAQDWKVSCGPETLSDFVSQVRAIEKTLSLRKTGITEDETKNKVWATKSLVLSKDMREGDILDEECLVAKRPGTGIPPNQLNEVVGRKILDQLEKDTILSWENLGE